MPPSATVPDHKTIHIEVPFHDWVRIKRFLIAQNCSLKVFLRDLLLREVDRQEKLDRQEKKEPSRV